MLTAHEHAQRCIAEMQAMDEPVFPDEFFIIEGEFADTYVKLSAYTTFAEIDVDEFVAKHDERRRAFIGMLHSDRRFVPTPDSDKPVYANMFSEITGKIILGPENMEEFVDRMQREIRRVIDKYKELLSDELGETP